MPQVRRSLPRRLRDDLDAPFFVNGAFFNDFPKIFRLSKAPKIRTSILRGLCGDLSPLFPFGSVRLPLKVKAP